MIGMSKPFFSTIDERRIVAAIHAAETCSRGEVRIHITEAPVDDPIKKATIAFEKLGMTSTAERNGVLILVAPTSRKFAVLGDSGLTTLTGTGVLDEIAAGMSAEFREGHFTEGLIAAVERAARYLAIHFPPKSGVPDTDELSNEISRG